MEKVNKNFHVYKIEDEKLKDIYKFGVGSVINKKGKSVRAETQVREFNRVANEERFSSKILHKDLGNLKIAKTTENAFISVYEKIHGRKPRGNQNLNKI